MRIEVGGYYRNTKTGVVARIRNIGRRNPTFMKIVTFDLYDYRGKRLHGHYMSVPDFKEWARFRVKPRDK